MSHAPHGGSFIYNETMENLIKALLSAQQEFAPLAKTATNPHFHNKFVPLHEVLANVLPILNKNGLVISQFPTSTPEGPGLTTYLMHVSGEMLHETMPLMLAKNDPQAQGSAITYARRYGLMAVLGVVGDEDDDGQAATKVTSVRLSPVDEAKDRLKAAIRASGVDASQFGWVKAEVSVKKINEAAQSLENVAKGLSA